jgi:hypothetical protein
MPVEREIRHEPFQSAVFLFHLPQPAEFAHAEVRIRLLPGADGGVTHPSCRQRSPTRVPDSAWQIAYTICSSENFDRFMGPLLS